MTSLYTREVDDFICSRDWPRAVDWSVREGNEPYPHLKIVFFRDNWLTLSVADQMNTTAIVKEICEKLWSDGIPIGTAKMESRREDTDAHA